MSPVILRPDLIQTMFYFLYIVFRLTVLASIIIDLNKYGVGDASELRAIRDTLRAENPKRNRVFLLHAEYVSITQMNCMIFENEKKKQKKKQQMNI